MAFIGAGTIGVSAIWTLAKLAKPVVGGLIGTLRASSAAASGDDRDRDLPPGVIVVTAIGCLAIAAWLAYTFASGSPLAEHAGLLTAIAVPFVFIVGFLIAGVAGYMAGLIGASNSPISGIGILGIVTCASILVMAVGIRPNTALAREAGLAVGRGVIVDDAMRTEDLDIFAVGECAEHRGVAYGLVAPIWDMCRTLAAALTGDDDAAYAGSLLSTRLKVSGVDVFSAGNFAGGEGCEDIVFRDEENTFTLEQRWRPRGPIDLSWGYRFDARDLRFVGAGSGETLARFKGYLASLAGAVVVDRRDNLFDARHPEFEPGVLSQRSEFGREGSVDLEWRW